MVKSDGSAGVPVAPGFTLQGFRATFNAIFPKLNLTDLESQLLSGNNLF